MSNVLDPLQARGGGLRIVKHTDWSSTRAPQNCNDIAQDGDMPESSEHPFATAAALEESESLNRSIVEASTDCIGVLDLEGSLLFMNEAGRAALELEDQSRLYGKSWIDMWPRAARNCVSKAVDEAANGGVARFSSQSPTAKGALKWWDVVVSPVLGADGAATKLVCISRDVTHQKITEDQVRWTANHDPLTKLANRSLFQHELDQRILNAQATGGCFALLLLDLDEFKRTNDTLGHDMGDALLCDLASRLREATRRDDFVARLGGDEFAIILGGIRDGDQLDAAVQGIFERLKDPCIHDGGVMDCQASIGASLYPAHGPGKLELMKHSDVALYAAKDAGRGTLRLFQPAMRSEVQRRSSMLAVARNAIADDRVMPFYQPKIHFSDGGLYGFEALLRWKHPTRGIQTPETIEAAFKDPNLAVAISDRMIERVIADVRVWLDRGVDFGHVAINAAAAEFRSGDFADRLLQQMHAASVPVECLQLEVTESVFLGRGAEHVGKALKTLSSAGLQIALDDFGTGYASLSHLKQFPVDIIKIDRSFIRDLHDDPEDEAIVRAVIGLGQSLDIGIVAEGIETPAQSAYLRKFGCDYGQGFLFGAAAPARRVPALTRQLGHAGRGRFPVPPATKFDAKPVDRATCPASPSAQNIYVVDDDPALRASTKFLLQTLGYQCRSFSSGAEFLNQLLTLEPGCILLDLRMDGLCGLQVLAELKWVAPTWPVVVMSGDAGTSVSSKAREHGAIEVLAKPFDEEALDRILRRELQTLEEMERETSGVRSRGALGRSKSSNAASSPRGTRPPCSATT